MASLFKKGRKKERKLSPSIYLSFLLISKFPFFSSFSLVVYKKGIVYFSLTLHFIIISQHFNPLTIIQYVIFSQYKVVFQGKIKYFRNINNIQEIFKCHSLLPNVKVKVKLKKSLLN